MEASFSCPADTPSIILGSLFRVVQARGLFADSKLFADAAPRGDPRMILSAFAAGAPWDDDALRRFVAEHFALPVEVEPAPPTGLPMREHIRAMWDMLARSPVTATGSALAIDQPFVVPGGRFRDLYYWDSYFTLLGLARDRPDLADALVDNFADLIERHGHVPNGARTYYLSRSQPPLFALMPALTPSGMTPRRRAAALAEYGWWMSGERVVTLPGGAVLNRYWDDLDTPRDESWREDAALAATTRRPSVDLWRNLRAGAESGWDFSSRWFGESGGLAGIRTTRIVPIDLNAFLYATEMILGLDEHASIRRDAIDRHLWNPAEERYADLDLDRGSTPHSTGAILAPLFAGCASDAQAAAVAALTKGALLAPGGLRTTLIESGEQWDAPNGWAPLQWIAIVGLRRYGHDGLADRIAQAWLHTVERHYASSGRILEKYDVERGGPGGGGEYVIQDGFGWTNGVTAALLDERVEVDGTAGTR